MWLVALKEFEIFMWMNFDGGKNVNWFEVQTCLDILTKEELLLTIQNFLISGVI